jgi:hypothetical protein
LARAFAHAMCFMAFSRSFSLMRQCRRWPRAGRQRSFLDGLKDVWTRQTDTR